ncbi:hypothetical protein Cgig2_013582 [Carnegiea gigantea]|uniref:Uncharacterized protein n=1 Tax=Carnegiea gigantea TaxID=171969 RepID=A0A9Q1KAL2_9CARY|nr:hypothetical protein Cgig2_013582 [Carnegiea gigantea]
MCSFSSLWNNSMKPILRQLDQWDLLLLEGKFSKWPVESIDPYDVCFRLLDGQKFLVTAFDVCMTLHVPLEGRQIVEITKSSVDEEYDKNSYRSKSVLKYVKDFTLEKLINSVRHYKENKAAKDVHLDGPLFFLMVLYLDIDFNIAVMKEVIADLHNAHMEFPKLQLKQQPNKDDGGPLFNPTFALHEPHGEA